MTGVPPLPRLGRLQGRTAIVTGAGSLGAGFGTGKAIALLFASEGARVALVDLDRDRAEETRAQIAAEGGDSAVVVGSVIDAEDSLRIVAEAVEALGSLDILVNNVGMGAGAGRLETIDPAAWQRGMDLNIASAFLMTRAAIPALLAGAGKAIVNIASVAGIRAHGSASYGPAKAAMIQFTRETAVMYGAEGIRANVIAPGHIMTPLVEKFSAPAARDNRRRVGALSSVEGDAWDIAYAALFLASSEARFISGVCLPVDGGVTQIGPLAAFERMTGESMTA
ncbi:MAG: SDR family oxidoreductase [Sphingomonadaceae bacterium]|nr:SDR family oxidoreductase [Sphingomonadaceae bacterium]